MLEIKLFGSGELQYCEQQAAGFPNQAPYLLFCYLLLNHQHLHNREYLAAVFWGDYSIANSRKMLRNTLWRLRQNLAALRLPVEDYFHMEEDNIGFLGTPPYHLDVECFENAVTPLQDIPGQSLTAAQASELETAAALYTGDLLEGIYDDWCLYDRERLRLMFQGTLCKLMVYSGINGFYEQGIQYGLRLLAMDATWEKIHRHLMWLYWLSGNRSAALAQYKYCQQVLREQLTTAPTPETQHQYELMLHQRFNPGAWLEKENPVLKINKSSTEFTSQMTDRLHQELRHLREMIEATRTESDLIEKLIGDFLNM